MVFSTIFYTTNKYPNCATLFSVTNASSSLHPLLCCMHCRVLPLQLKSFFLDSPLLQQSTDPRWWVGFALLLLCSITTAVLILQQTSTLRLSYYNLNFAAKTLVLIKAVNVQSSTVQSNAIDWSYYDSWLNSVFWTRRDWEWQTLGISSIAV